MLAFGPRYLLATCVLCPESMATARGSGSCRGAKANDYYLALLTPESEGKKTAKHRCHALARWDVYC